MSQRFVIPIRRLNWGNALFTAILAAVALLSLTRETWPGTLVFGGMAAAMVVYMARSGHLAVDTVGITHVAGASTYHIRWDELVAVGLVDMRIVVLLGDGKLFAIPPFPDGGTGQRAAVQRFIEAQVTARALPRQHIDVRRTDMHRNVKVDPSSIVRAPVDAPRSDPQPAAAGPASSRALPATEAEVRRTPIDGCIVIPPIGAWLMWALFGVPAAMSVFALLGGAPVASLIILLVGTPGLLGALRTGTYEVTEYWVAHRCPLATYRIFWDEVTLVELGEGWSVALRGGDKRFVMPSFHDSPGRVSPEAQRMVREKIASLPARHVHQPALWIGWHRNARE